MSRGQKGNNNSNSSGPYYNSGNSGNSDNTDLTTDMAGQGKEMEPLAVYLAQVGQIPLLSSEQERNLFVELSHLRETLDDAETDEYSEEQKRYHFVKNILIRANLRLVISIAKRYQYFGLQFLDLIEEGNIGLIEAVDRFDPTKKVRFSTYGTWWIRQAIIKALGEKSRLIRIPTHVLSKIKHILQAAGDLSQELGREPSVAELAEAMNTPVVKVAEILRFSQEPGSLEIPVEDGNFLEIGDMLEDKNADLPIDQLLVQALRDILLNIFQKLNQRERQVLEHRFGFIRDQGPLTLEETGHILGITRERVRQIQSRALQKIKKLPASRELREFM